MRQLFLPNMWLPMRLAPRDCAEIRVILRDGTVHDRCHYARDLSGEEQPPFEGFFVRRGSHYSEVDPVAWMRRT
jgi:hypothetical protein